MAVKKILPYRDYRNGIVKHIFPTNKSTEIEVTNTPYNHGFHYVYPTAFLDDEISYFQASTDPATINLTFKKTIFLTHFAAISWEVNGAAWNYPKTFKVTGCRNEECTVLDSIQNSERYNSTKFVLTPVQPGTFNKIIIKMSNNGPWTIVLRRFEIFGYLCDNPNE